MYSPNLSNLHTYEQGFYGPVFVVYVFLQEDLGGETPFFYYFQFLMMTSQHFNFSKICSGTCYIIQNILLSTFLKNRIVRKIKAQRFTHITTLLFIRGPKNGQKMRKKWRFLVKNGLLIVSDGCSVREFLLKRCKR